MAVGVSSEGTRGGGVNRCQTGAVVYPRCREFLWLARLFLGSLVSHHSRFRAKTRANDVGNIYLPTDRMEEILRGLSVRKISLGSVAEFV